MSQRFKLNFFLFLILPLSFMVKGQDVIMQNGSFVRCAPDLFYDSGGTGVNYGNNEDYTITICPSNPSELIGLNFTQFSTQENFDIMTIYNGDSDTSPVLGVFSGMSSPGLMVASNPTGCLTIHFFSDNIGTTLGWTAEIMCLEECQTIVPTILSTDPAFNANGIIEISSGEEVTFNGSATFSEDNSNAIYSWDFGDGNTASGPMVMHQFNSEGTYEVIFTANDNNPLGCAESETITVVVLGRLVTINNAAYTESFYSLEQLIDEVLVTGGCSEVNNFSFQVAGNPDDLQNKSYGYFTRGGASRFPFEDGIVLSNGSAFQGGNSEIGPIISVQNGIPGDADLETALNVVDTFDATFIKFNFTPTIDTISFRYLMASEEYGEGLECAFADSFAFLLREVGTTDYINLAVLPDGTPVSVTNINDANACNSNPSFFEGYNLGDTNFGGRTKVLTATAAVTPNVTYEIKLVVADQGDDVYDSAIFLEAGSFNLGGELGEDITIAAGTAECGGGEVLLDTSAPNAGHIWYKDGVEIPDETGSTLNVFEPGIYSVDVIFAVGCQVSDSILIEFRTAPVIEGAASDLSTCSGSNQAQFDLTFNTGIIIGTQDPSLFNLTYHTTFNNADMDVNPITNPETYLGTDGDIIHFRIEDADSGICYETASFSLNVFSAVTAEEVTYTLCDDDSDGDDTNGIVEFDLSAIDIQVLGTQDPSQFSVSYHISLAEAEAKANPLPNLFTNTTTSGEQIYARVENDFNTDCFETSIITLVVNQLPTIVNSIELRQCDDDTDGFSDFNLTEANNLISGNAASETFTYYTTLLDAESQLNEIVSFTSYTNTDPSSNPDILFVRVENSSGCSRVAELNLIVSTTQIPAGYNILYETCDDGSVDDDITNGITTFDFSDATMQIEALYPVGQDIEVTYYENEEDALAEINQIIDISNFRNENSPFTQNIIVRVDSNTDNACLGFGEHITLRSTNPIPNNNLNNLVLCDDTNVGDLQEIFDLTLNETDIFIGDPNLTASYYTSLNQAISGTNPIPDAMAFQNTQSPQTIFVRVLDVNTNCFAIVDFELSVNPLPTTTVIEDYMVCENGTDGFYEFDLSTKTSEILNGQDPSLFNVTYHETQLDADNLSNPISLLYTNITNPQTIYVAITNADTNCSVSSISFNLDVMEGALANGDGIPLIYELCDNVGENDGFGQFDLSALTEEILDGQDPNAYTLTFHDSFVDANNDSQPIPLLYENTSIDGNLANPQVIFVRVSNNISPDICYDIEEITLIVNPYPEFELNDLYILCTTTNGSEVIEVPPLITTGLSETEYSFEWYLDGALLAGQTNSSIIPQQGGVYEVIVSDITSSSVTRCATSKSTIVMESDIPEFSAEVISNAFSGRHTIQISILEPGSYEFSLDNGPWQTELEFTNVPGGIYTVYARDVNGCGVSSTEVLALDYKKYFTPNGDGNHDLWRIEGIETQPTSKIYIFDRYGKLLKELDPNGPGWDGTYAGNLMPSDDYWFVILYNDVITGQQKEFKAHFTLKR